MIEPNTVLQSDCVEALNGVEKPFADLIFADPPFNIGYKYDVYEDRKAYDDYYAWTESWMRACTQVLKPTGSFWIAIGDDYAAEVRMIGRKLGLTLRNWVIWYYTFGQNMKRKFARSHTHLFYWVTDPQQFTFNDEAVRTFSDRQREYNDKRANKAGKIPDDVWSEFPRVCGTFGEREGWHPCQMPETLLGRIIRVCSDIGDCVLDPFAGSGTTLVAAKKLCRDYVGVELSANYVKEIRKRLEQTQSMADIRGERTTKWPEEHKNLLKSTYAEGGVTTDQLQKNPHLMASFAQHCNLRLSHSGAEEAAYTVEEVETQLVRLRKSGQLPKIRVHARESRTNIQSHVKP